MRTKSVFLLQCKKGFDACDGYMVYRAFAYMCFCLNASAFTKKKRMISLWISFLVTHNDSEASAGECYSVRWAVIMLSWQYIFEKKFYKHFLNFCKGRSVTFFFELKCNEFNIRIY